MVRLTDSIKYDINTILDVILAFKSETGHDRLLHTILAKMMEITNSDAGTLYIVEDNKLHFRIVKNSTLGITKTTKDQINLPPVELDKENCVHASAYCAIHNEIIIVDDVYENKRFNFSGAKKYDRITGYRSKSMLALPLFSYWNQNPQLLGVIQLINATDPRTGVVVEYGDVFDPPIVPAFANIAANSLSNLIHIKEINDVFQSFVTAMARAIDERSVYNSNHTQNVARLVGLFGRHLTDSYPPGHRFHFEPKRLDELVMAATLHDIGKIVTPISIMDKADKLGDRLPAIRSRVELRKLQLEIEWLRGEIAEGAYRAALAKLVADAEFVEGAAAPRPLQDGDLERIEGLKCHTYRNSAGSVAPIFDDGDMECLSIPRGTLTAAERKIMEEHVSVTGRLLDSVAFSKYSEIVPKIAKSHHEFLDGSGYPNGLRGGQISTESCIVTIADIFEALTAMDRPYKSGMPPGAALGILDSMANEGKLHKELVGLFAQSGVWLGASAKGDLQ